MKVPYLLNSALAAPSTFHTSLERFSIATVRKPICRLLRMAARVVGPVTITRWVCCSSVIRPGRRITSANRPSVGRYMMAKSVECGGCTYLAEMVLACSFTARSSAWAARSTSSGWPESWAASSRS